MNNLFAKFMKQCLCDIIIKVYFLPSITVHKKAPKFDGGFWFFIHFQSILRWKKGGRDPSWGMLSNSLMVFSVNFSENLL